MSGSRSARSTNSFSCLAISGSNSACGPPTIRATSTPAWPSTAMCPAGCELLRDVRMWSSDELAVGDCFSCGIERHRDVGLLTGEERERVLDADLEHVVGELS